MPNDRELLFLTMVRQNDSRLRRICRVYAHDVEARKDLHQEILLQLWRSLPSFSGASSLDTWVYRVALNTALAQARRRLARPDDTLTIEFQEHEHATEAHVDEPIETGERMEQLLAAIDRLHDIDKMLITMYLDERSYREMADVIGISESHVGVKLHRIRTALARWLAEETV